MRRLLATAIATALITIGAISAHADQPERKILLIYGNHIDGPIAHTAVAFARDMYPDVGFALVWTPHFVNARPNPHVDETFSCIIGVGQDGQTRAQWWWAVHAANDPKVVVAQGADRYQTAFRVADAVDECLQ